MAYLEVETREGVRRFALVRDRLRIGRLAHNDIVLPFTQISRQHAELRRVNDQWWIADLHSTNGIHLNTHRIKEHALEHGDKVLLAPDITLRFVGTGDAGDQPTIQTPAPRRPVWPAPSPTPIT